jgi:hypothetical protein
MNSLSSLHVKLFGPNRCSTERVYEKAADESTRLLRITGFLIVNKWHHDITENKSLCLRATLPANGRSQQLAVDGHFVAGFFKGADLI